MINSMVEWGEMRWLLIFETIMFRQAERWRVRTLPMAVQIMTSLLAAEATIGSMEPQGTIISGVTISSRAIRRCPVIRGAGYLGPTSFERPTRRGMTIWMGAMATICYWETSAMMSCWVVPAQTNFLVTKCREIPALLSRLRNSTGERISSMAVTGTICSREMAATMCCWVEPAMTNSSVMTESRLRLPQVMIGSKAEPAAISSPVALETTTEMEASTTINCMEKTETMF